MSPALKSCISGRRCSGIARIFIARLACCFSQKCRRALHQSIDRSDAWSNYAQLASSRCRHKDESRSNELSVAECVCTLYGVEMLVWMMVVLKSRTWNKFLTIRKGHVSASNVCPRWTQNIAIIKHNPTKHLRITKLRGGHLEYLKYYCPGLLGRRTFCAPSSAADSRHTANFQQHARQSSKDQQMVGRLSDLAVGFEIDPSCIAESFGSFRCFARWCEVLVWRPNREYMAPGPKSLATQQKSTNDLMTVGL